MGEQDEGYVHGIDVAHKNVAEQEIELVLGAAERGAERADADGVFVVLDHDAHRGTQFHRVDGVRDASIRNYSSKATQSRRNTHPKVNERLTWSRQGTNHASWRWVLTCTAPLNWL